MTEPTKQEVIEALETATEYAGRFVEDWGTGLDEGIYEDKAGYEAALKDLKAAEQVLDRLKERG